jgi:two-component system phosphate regulon sensor histidine kinase PhoR
VKLTRRIVILIVAATVLSLAGLVVVQLLLLSNARQLKEQAFRDNAVSALQTVVRQLETREIAGKAMRFTGPPRQGKGLQVMALAISDTTFHQSDAGSSSGMSASHQAIPFWVASDTLHYSVPRRQRVTITIRDSVGGTEKMLVDSETAAGSYELPLHDSLPSPRSIFVRMADDREDTFEMNINCLDSLRPINHSRDSNRMFIVSQVVDNLILGEAEPIEKRLDTVVVDSLLTASFASAGITLPYSYAVISTTDDSIRLASATLDRESVRTSDLKTRLFPSDLFSVPAELAVVFPDRASFVSRQLLPMTAATTIFMVIIAICFVYSIVTIMRQRRFAQLTVDFINNMTHEFKTPLATVGLACDALARPDVAAQADQVDKYQSMIRDENRRMRSNVDKILQMAVLEEGDYELTISEVDVHNMISSVVRGFALQVEHRGGSISLKLGAVNPLVTADPMHLTNIIANLLDNAAKYSTDAPQVSVTTANDGRKLKITVADHGIGIPERDLPHLFDKYYRVRTGNVHDVKGFGIGLSYVKLMTSAMGGTIDIASKQGEGTTATLTIPLAG